MKNRFVKITLTLCMLLVMAVPTQAFAAEKCNIKSSDTANNYSKIYTQLSQCRGNFSQLCSKNINNEQIQKLWKQFCPKAAQTTPVKVAKAAKVPSATCPLVKQNSATCPLTNAKQNTTTCPLTNAKPETTTPAKPETTTPAKPETTTPAKPETTTPAKPETTTPAKPTPETTVPTDSNLGSYEQQVVDLVNKERAAAGLPALKVNTKLAGVAEKKAEDLRDKNYFSHTSPTYGSPFDMMKQFGINYTSAGENIAKGQRTPDSVMSGWMNSQGHRENILNSSYSEIGVGYVTDSNGNTYWVQMFIRP